MFNGDYENYRKKLGVLAKKYDLLSMLFIIILNSIL
jgi:hypothetical protein